jgi:hypothetical protein
MVGLPDIASFHAVHGNKQIQKILERRMVSTGWVPVTTHRFEWGDTAGGEASSMRRYIAARVMGFMN